MRSYSRPAASCSSFQYFPNSMQQVLLQISWHQLTYLHPPPSPSPLPGYAHTHPCGDSVPIPIVTDMLSNGRVELCNKMHVLEVTSGWREQINLDSSAAHRSDDWRGIAAVEHGCDVVCQVKYIRLGGRGRTAKPIQLVHLHSHLQEPANDIPYGKMLCVPVQSA